MPAMPLACACGVAYGGAPPPAQTAAMTRVVSDNPPFILAFTRGIDKKTGKLMRRSWIEQILESDLLVEGGILAFLGRTQWGQSREHWPIIERHPPVHQVRSGGRLSFADTGSTASDEYSMWVWIKGHPTPASPTWTTTQLAPMPEGRRWAEIPGTYDLPANLFDGCPPFNVVA